MQKHFAIAILMLALAGCSDPLEDVERLSDVPLDETAPEREVAADENDAPPTGILGALFGRGRPEPAAAESEDARETNEAVTAAAQPDTLPGDGETADLPEEDTPAPLAAATPAAPATAETDAAPGGGFLGLFRRNPAPAPGADAVADASPEVAPATSTEPARTPDALPPVQVAAAGTTAGGGFLGGLFSGGGGSSRSGAMAGDPNAPDVAEGERMAFGEVGRLCGKRAASLGKEIARWPERGGKYRLYDSFPASTSPRPFYVSGFKDGCLRQFTAALALFGDPAMHEQLRYGLPAKQIPYSDTDKGYETVKSRVCRVGARKPCGARIERLSRDTVFLSSYDRFGGGQRWANMLLHDGEIVATDIKSK